MSDFDKEAEREKLREKYEQDEKKRETTEQMSELLLKGATMTNAHCGDCGDPIFRYDGQEFCPTCQKPVDRGTGDDAAGDSPDEEATTDADATAGENGQPQGGIEVTSPSDDATVQFGGDAADADDGADAGARSTDQAETAVTGNQDVNRQQIPSADPSATRNPRTGVDDSPSEPVDPSRGTNETAGDHLGRAQVILAQTVERFARRAAETDDPRTAREHLETAREAAQTLDAARF